MRHPRERFVIQLDHRATWDDLLEVPDDFIGEIVAGKLVAAPRPANPHGLVASELYGVLHPPFRVGNGGPGGWVLVAEPRIRFGDDIRVPDVAGWHRDRYSGPATGPMTVTPDWICEVLSPSTEAEDRGPKMHVYHRAGVGHLWLINWQVRTVEVYRHATSGWLLVGTYSGDARLRAEPFEAVELDLSILWTFAPPLVTEEE